MTTFTGDVNVRGLDSSVTAINFQRGGGATFTGPMVFTSTVGVSGNMSVQGNATITGTLNVVGVTTFTGLPTFTSAVFVSALANVTAQQPVVLQTITSAGGNVRCRGTFAVIVDGTTCFVPFWYGGQ